MGNFLDKPRTEKRSHEGRSQSLSYCLSYMQGWRLEQEDAHTHELSLPAPFEKWSFFSVFDGHAGSLVAEESSKRLLPKLLDQEYFKTLAKEETLIKENTYDIEKLSEAIQEGFLDLDEDLRNADMNSGSTCTSLLITPIHYVFINAGDSRSLLIKKDLKFQSESNNSYQYKLHESYAKAIKEGHFGAPNLEEESSLDGESSNGNGDKEGNEKTSEKATGEGDSEKQEKKEDDPGNYYVQYSTIDHKPYDDDEKARIEAAGGMVIIQRINGALAVSRALGDFDYKRNSSVPAREQQVSALPVVQVLNRELNEDSSDKDAFAVLACDGIYDTISNENLSKYITYKLLSGSSVNEVTKSCLDLCLTLGSRDNMSLCIVDLGNLPKPVDRLQEHEQKLDKEIVDLLDDELANNAEYKNYQNFATPSDKIFYDLYMKGKLKQKCGDEYIFSPPVEVKTGPAPQSSYSGGYVDKHRVIRKHLEKLSEQSSRAE